MVARKQIKKPVMEIKKTPSIDFERTVKAMLTSLKRTGRLSDALAPLEEGLRTRLTKIADTSDEVVDGLSGVEPVLACIGLSTALGIQNAIVDRYSPSDPRDLYAAAQAQYRVSSPDALIPVSPSLWFAMLLAELDGAVFPISVVNGPEAKSSLRPSGKSPAKSVAPEVLYTQPDPAVAPLLAKLSALTSLGNKMEEIISRLSRPMAILVRTAIRESTGFNLHAVAKTTGLELSFLRGELDGLVRLLDNPQMIGVTTDSGLLALQANARSLFAKLGNDRTELSIALGATEPPASIVLNDWLLADPLLSFRTFLRICGQNDALQFNDRAYNTARTNLKRKITELIGMDKDG